MARSKVKSRSHHDAAHLHPLAKVKGQIKVRPLLILLLLLIAQTTFYRSRSLWQGQRSNEGQTMTLHTYTPKAISLPSINFLHLTVSDI